MRSLRFEFKLLALALLAIGAVTLGVVNLREQHRYELPDDGVFWVQSAGGVVARGVSAGSPADRAGIVSGDRLLSAEGVEVSQPSDVARTIFARGIGSHLQYTVVRNGSRRDFTLLLTAATRSPLVHNVLQLVAFLYLAIGFFVVVRRYTARRAIHFYLFCLASFALFLFSYTGKLNTFDWTVYWLNVAAMLSQPALFAHFCLAYPEQRIERNGFDRRLILGFIYGPAVFIAAMHAGVATGFVRFGAPLVELRWLIDRIEIAYFVAMYMVGIALLFAARKKAVTLIGRKQVSWVLGGSLLAIVPFGAFYGLPYFLGQTPVAWMEMSALSLIVLPLTFAYAIAHYRLLEPGAVLERGVAYTLATAVLVGGYFGLAALAGMLFHSTFPGGGTAGIILAVVATGVFFQPLQRWIQSRLEQHLLGQRHDYREALLAVGRNLSCETDMNRMTDSFLDQLTRALNVPKAAVFVRQFGDGNNFALRASRAGNQAADRVDSANSALAYDMGFVCAPSLGGPNEIKKRFFFSDPEQMSGEIAAASAATTAWRNTASWMASELGLHYFFPCRVRDNVVAVLALGKTADGELLWDEDAAVVETLSGYLAIAVENVRLVESVTCKARQYERLQEFSENILESINVGLLAVDLDDRVEAFNTPLKMMAPVDIANLHEDARGKKLSEVLPVDLAEQLHNMRDDGGIHNIYRYHVTSATGEDRVLNIAVAPLLSKNCDWIGRLIIFDDVTDRVGLEAQLAHAEKLSSIGLLAAGVAHEVNTPLTVISTHAQMLAKQLAPDDKKFKAVEKIIGQTFRASEIVNSLLNFSRTKGTSFSPLDVNRIVSETLLLLDHQLKSAHIVVESDLETSVPSISGNSDKLQQVFLNLFLNAKDAMPEGGRLRISTRAENSHLEIEISDTGTGIAPEHLNRIYDPFFTTKGSGRGTGLGLAVSYGIIHEHAGDIKVESMPGVGTRFRLEFPTVRKPVHA